jgi:hypothetical protein
MSRTDWSLSLRMMIVPPLVTDTKSGPGSTPRWTSQAFRFEALVDLEAGANTVVIKGNDGSVGRGGELPLTNGERECRAQDKLRDDGNVVEHVVSIHPKHLPTERVEVTIAPGIMPLAALMGIPIDLDDEAELGACKVDDEVPDDELPAEGESELGSGETLPEGVLGSGGRQAHPASLLLEPSGTSRRDEVTSEHEVLREGRTRERAERSPPRRFRDARWRSARAEVWRGMSPSEARGAERARRESSARSRVRLERAPLNLGALPIAPITRCTPARSQTGKLRRRSSPVRAQAAGRARTWGRRAAKPRGWGQRHPYNHRKTNGKPLSFLSQTGRLMAVRS